MIYNEILTRGTEDFPIEYYHVDKNHPRYVMSIHWHSELEIIRVLEGSLHLKLDNDSYHAGKGDIIFINPETVHGATPDDCVYECIVFRPDFLYVSTYSCRFFFDSLLSREFVVKEFSPCTSDDFHLAANELFEAMRIKTSGHKFRVISSIFKLFGIITDNHLYSNVNIDEKTAGNKNFSKLKKVLTFMRENFDKQITLDDIAAVSETSTKYFSTFFKNMTGKTPFEYLNSYRIERASQLLLHSDINVTEIAYSCGFNDLSYFIKTFKSAKGVSPGQFRKN